MKIKTLFVCLGNICRSPAAEELFRMAVVKRGLENSFEIDSAGTYGGHAGSLADSRMRQAAARRGVQITHRSRQVRSDDFEDFDVIIAMDDQNFHNLQRLAPTIEATEKIVRMIDYVEKNQGYTYIPDPYYEGAEGFELVLDLLEDGCERLLDQLVER